MVDNIERSTDFTDQNYLTPFGDLFNLVNINE